MNRFQLLPGAFGAIARKSGRLALAGVALVAGLASTADAHLSLVIAPPKYVTLDTTTGAVRVTRKTESAPYLLLLLQRLFPR